MTPQQFDFHIHLVCDHPGSKRPDLLNSVYQLSIGSPYQLTSGSDTEQRRNWIATIGYTYVNAPISAQDRRINPLGFQVYSYRVDPESVAAN
ncbi:type IV secretion system protein [Thauera aminoaromatica]|uniref:type IV secretion system protein n=1 Tax=Thauera aminoaromatica TaxID=164330 RepID=UPI0023F1E980|nr:type IV secretion system protein [Thauera aminoaromatica]